MANIYAQLIIKGKKLYSDVPDKLKEQVKDILISLGHEDLVEVQEEAN